MSRIAGHVVLATACCLLIGARAEAADDHGPSFAKSMTATCLTEASSVLQDAEFKPVLDAHPVDIQKVCACAEESFLKDARLRQYLRADGAVLFKRMESKQFLAYASLRYTNVLFVCTSAEIEASLSAVNLLP